MEEYFSYSQNRVQLSKTVSVVVTEKEIVLEKGGGESETVNRKELDRLFFLIKNETE